MSKLDKEYLTIEQLKLAGLKYEYGNYVLKTTGNRLYKDANGYYIKRKANSSIMNDIGGIDK